MPTAIVTGASSGIGLAISRHLAATGWDLLAVSIDGTGLEAAARQIGQQWPGRRVDTLCLDLARDTAADEVYAAADRLGLRPTLLVNNAGVFDLRYLDQLDTRRIDLYIGLHIRAVTLLSRLAARRMAAEGGGAVLNMSSMACWMPMPGIAMYAATKAYVRSLTRSLHTEWAGRGVTFTAACPGGIATGLFGLPPRLLRLGVRLGVLATPEAFARKVIRRTLKGRAQYVNGPLNRVAIAVVSSLPEWFKNWARRKFMDGPLNN